MRNPLIVFILAMAAVPGCDAPAPSSPAHDAGTDATVARVTWHQDIAPIVHQHCVGCHQPGGIGPFSLIDYDDAGPVADYLLAKIESGEMPPWSASDAADCAPRFGWKDDPRLSADELETFRTWVDDGAALGDPATAAPLPEPEETSLEGATDRLAPETPYVTSGFIDELVCFVLDPSLTSLTWLTGVEFLPGNFEVAHHATLTAIPVASANDILSRVGPDGSFRCTGGVGIDGAYSLGVWVPGARPFETPDGTGIPLAAGTVMVLQMHYHPTGFEHAPDQTIVDLRLQSTPPGKTFMFTAVGNTPIAPVLQPGPNDRGIPEFRIPAGATEHSETMVFEIDNPDLGRRLPITAMFPHMHYVGTDLKVSIERATPGAGEPANECLVNVPNWNFDWQRTYHYDADLAELPTIGDGDRITIECGYDNSLGNPFVHRMLLDEGLEDPIDVFLGEQTTDEMCLVAIGVIL